MNDRNSAFTLIEVMVVMLLLSIVMAVAVPRFHGGALQDPIKKTSRWVSNSVRTLRNNAAKEQRPYVLAIDLQNNRMWAAHASMDDADLVDAEKKAYTLPSSLRIMGVRFTKDQRVSTGVTEITFYPGGYSDRAVLDLEDDEARRYSILIEPLLPKIKFFETWISF